MKIRETKAFVTASASAIAVVAAMTLATPAFAAEPAAPAADDAQGGIVVTARKRGEDILKVPVTVTAMTSEALEQRGIVSMQDVASATPGVNINNSSSGHADRSFQQVVLRGFTPSTTLATTTSLFIDGTPVASPSAFTAISNPERVEVLKGPQSAYFGRNTFAGAINVVNKNPSSTWTGTLTGMVGTHDNWRLSGSVEGPIIGDVLTFRITGDKFSKSGSWINANGGQTLGDQASVTATALIVYKPSPAFTLKVFGMRGEDNDGPAAQARLYATSVYSNGGVPSTTTGTQIVQGQSNCSFTGYSNGSGTNGTSVTNPYICGITPSLINPVSMNVTTTDAVRSFLNQSANRIVSPNESVQGYGLRRITHHAHATADYKITSDLTASVLAGYNREVWSTFIDLDSTNLNSITQSATGTVYTGGYDFPYLIERKTLDWSVEGRLSYAHGPIHAMAGVSFLDARQYSGGGGNVATLSSATLIAGGKSENKTTGIFFGLTYDITSQFSASFEGRYQIDALGAYARASGQTIAASTFIPAGTYAPGALLTSATYRNFTPRAILNYQITPRLMVYASWAKGVNPAQFNTSILSQSATVQAAAAAAGGVLAVQPEKLTNWELGIKGKALDGRLRYTAAAYYSQWRNEINAVTIIAAVPVTPTTPTGYSFVTASANAGSVDLYGVEGEFALKVNDLITIDGAAAINASRILDYRAPTISQLTGVFNFRGKEMKNTSKYSATMGITFGGEVAGLTDSKWFWRTDWIYKSGVWSNEANVVRTPDLHLFNMRAGITKGNVSLEVFANNLFNNHTYNSISDNYTFPTGLAYYSAVLVGLPELRTLGIQAKVKF
ncbi:TonB-dependent receptor [Novosphingobium sp. FSY-8]|uniref:TonB-dependent receptor n=1 Tax=Novosphingobium ovatum TaxID=1908523 RepID=A0ABW9XBQ7_9SPHN|nr:TonB-dependent receptor [Novosphingobium ovatum]NBC35969.1 TonB-dependent receptor [Novosphingobium ovatum]